MMPRSGDVLYVGEAASVQFAGDRQIWISVISTRTLGSTPDGWVWIDGYALDTDGNALERREILVQLAGLRRAMPAPQARRPAA